MNLLARNLALVAVALAACAASAQSFAPIPCTRTGFAPVIWHITST